MLNNDQHGTSEDIKQGRTHTAAQCQHHGVKEASGNDLAVGFVVKKVD